MVVAEDPPVPRDSRTEVYAMDMIQKAKRMYMGDYLFRGIVSWKNLKSV